MEALVNPLCQRTCQSFYRKKSLNQILRKPVEICDFRASTYAFPRFVFTIPCMLQETGCIVMFYRLACRPCVFVWSIAFHFIDLLPSNIARNMKPGITFHTKTLAKLGELTNRNTKKRLVPLVLFSY